jgi:putative Holliday junction resolvase
LALGSVFPRGAGILAGDKMDEAVLRILSICREEAVEGIVIGTPKRSIGEEGTISDSIKSFAQKIFEATKLPIYFEPEQYTSTEADAFLKEHNINFDRKSGKVDELAAVIILEQFLQRMADMGSQNVIPDIGQRLQDGEKK